MKKHVQLNEKMEQVQEQILPINKDPVQHLQNTFENVHWANDVAINDHSKKSAVVEQTATEKRPTKVLTKSTHYYP